MNRIALFLASKLAKKIVAAILANGLSLGALSAVFPPGGVAAGAAVLILPTVYYLWQRRR